MKDCKQVLKNIFYQVNLAYWKNEQDCGSDFDKEACQECKNHEMCKLNNEFESFMKKLKN